MPFTPSHAVVALPFVRTPLVPAAIAIGAMTPDLPLFLRGFGITYSFTHTWANLLWTMVLALGLFLLWCVVLRPAASELSPTWLARRLPREWDSPASDAAARAVGIGQPRIYGPLLVVSLALGVASHIVWDSFTHEGRAGVELLPVLAQQWGPLLGYKWLQHGSGLLGVAIIAIWALRAVKSAEPRVAADRVLPGWVRTVWWLSLPVILIAAWIVGSVVHGPFTAEFTYRHLAYRMLPPACGIWAMLTLGLCVVTAIVGGRRPSGAAARS